MFDEGDMFNVASLRRSALQFIIHSRGNLFYATFTRSKYQLEIPIYLKRPVRVRGQNIDIF